MTETVVGDVVTTTRKRPRSIEKHDEVHDMKKMQQVHVQISEQQMKAQEEEEEQEETTTEQSRGRDWEEEETLVVLELCDFKNHPLFDDYSSATLEVRVQKNDVWQLK